MPRRTEFPQALKNFKTWNSKAARGATRWVRLGPVGCLQWKDNKLISMITTMHKNISQRIFCSRRAKVNGNFRKLEVSQPEVVRDYNK